jgi:hypothetical protein
MIKEESNTRVIGVSEEGEKQKEEEVKSEERMTRNVSELVRRNQYTVLVNLK